VQEHEWRGLIAFQSDCVFLCRGCRVQVLICCHCDRRRRGFVPDAPSKADQPNALYCELSLTVVLLPIRNSTDIICSLMKLHKKMFRAPRWSAALVLGAEISTAP
jgi:hypothetical protein